MAKVGDKAEESHHRESKTVGPFEDDKAALHSRISDEVDTDPIRVSTH